MLGALLWALRCLERLWRVASGRWQVVCGSRAQVKIRHLHLRCRRVHVVADHGCKSVPRPLCDHQASLIYLSPLPRIHHPSSSAPSAPARAVPVVAAAAAMVFSSSTLLTTASLLSAASAQYLLGLGEHPVFASARR